VINSRTNHIGHKGRSMIGGGEGGDGNDSKKPIFS